MVINQPNTTIKNKHFICQGEGFEALKVNTENTLIENNLFENCDTAINIYNANHTKVTKNRFEKVGAGVIFTSHASNTNVDYNEFINIGERDCTRATGGGNCNVFGSREFTTNATFSHNLIDNRGAKSYFMEDYIGLYTGNERTVSNITIEDNLIIGSSEKDASSFSGACIVIDGKGSRYTIRKNSCYNVSGYGIATAGGSQIKVEENSVYMDKNHHDSIKKEASGNSHTYAYGITNFAKRGCGDDIQFLYNKGYAYHDAYANKVKSAWMPCVSPEDKNSFPDGHYDYNIVLKGNDFKESDPQWNPPSNIFSNLGENYFSGKEYEVVEEEAIPSTNEKGEITLIGNALITKEKQKEFFNNNILLDGDAIWYNGEYYMSHDAITSQVEANTKEKVSDFLKHSNQIGATTIIEVKTSNPEEYRSVINILHRENINFQNINFWVRTQESARVVSELAPVAGIFFWQENPQAIIKQLEREGNPFGIKVIGYHNYYDSKEIRQQIKQLKLKTAVTYQYENFSKNQPEIFEDIDYVITKKPIELLKEYPEYFKKKEH